MLFFLIKIQFGSFDQAICINSNFNSVQILLLCNYQCQWCVFTVYSLFEWISRRFAKWISLVHFYRHMENHRKFAQCTHGILSNFYCTIFRMEVNRQIYEQFPTNQMYFLGNWVTINTIKTEKRKILVCHEPCCLK